MTKAFEEDIETPPTRNIPSPGQLDPDTRIPVINLEDGTRLVGDEAPKNKDLVEWLKLHPAYTVDMPSYVPVSVTELTAAGSLARTVLFILPYNIEISGPPALLACLPSRKFPGFCHCMFCIRETSFRPVLCEGQPCSYSKIPIMHFLIFSISPQTDMISSVILCLAWF